MIKLFRKVRQRLLAESKFTQYLIYAFGEIVLVVIGILIALSLNNWNGDQKAQNDIHNYYERIHLELEIEIKSIQSFTAQEEYLRWMNERTLKILNSKNHDSIPALRETLGALGTAWTYTANFPITKEFISQGYLSKIKSDSTKAAFKDFVFLSKMIDMSNKNVTAQYHDQIETFIHKHINYWEVALPRYKSNLVEGGPPTDFESLFTNLELWNIVTLKLETLNLNVYGQKKVIERLKNLDKQILSELENN